MTTINRIIAACLLAAFSGGCTQMAEIGMVEGAGGRAALLRDGRSLSVRVAESQPVGLVGFYEAQLRGSTQLGTERVALVSGQAENCPYAMALVVVPDSGPARLERIPECRNEMSFLVESQHVTASRIEPNGSLRAWRYADGALTGPLTTSPAIARRVSRPRGGVAGGVQATPDLVPVLQAGPASPPKVSPEVGDGVIPEEISGASRAPAPAEVTLR